MDSIFLSMYPIPDSYSRQLDDRVAMQEMPYGYDLPPPPADTGDYNQRRIETRDRYPMRNGKVR